MKKEGIRIGLFSRIDAGSPRYRRGLVIKDFETFKDEKTHFNVLLGGLVAKKEVANSIKKEINAIKERNKEERKKKKEERQIEIIDRAAIEDKILDVLAVELSEAIPRLPRPRVQDGKFARLYIMTSPAHDGEYGERVAEKLTQLRPDIRYWSEADEHFPLKGIGKKLLGLVPKKESWRSEYDSAPVDREVKDHQRRTTRPLPDLYGVGCFASSIFKPRGEAKRHYFSVPASSKLGEVKTSENQIGVIVAEVFPRDEDILVAKRTYSFKDLVSREREFIEIPPRCSEIQKKILGALKERGSQPIGLIEDATGICREKLMPCLKRMLESERFQPKICFDKASGRYDFDQKWSQTNLIYPNGEEEYQEDITAGFGCLHATNINCDAKFFVDELPKVILEIGAKVLAGLGDFIEGLKHHLIERGEVVGGLNYTYQEIHAAHLVAEVISRVFKARFQKALETKTVDAGELKNVILACLLTFVYIDGNHDDWAEDEGFTPLATFRYELINVLRRKLAEVLKENGYYLPELDEIVESKIIKTNFYTLPSGLDMELFHLHMARAKTTVLRLQDTIEKSKARIIWSANYHVATSMNRWSAELGQRVGMQVGAIVHNTKFEDRKGKLLDTGFGTLRVRSRNKRIFMTEEIFHIAPENGEVFNNEEILIQLEKKIGIR